jgi:hypothetical protein
LCNKFKRIHLSLQKKKVFSMDNKPKKKKTIRPDAVRDAIICTEFAKDGRPSIVAKRYGVHHSYVTRLWEKLSEEEKHAFRLKAEDVRDIAAEKIIAEQADAITTITEELIDLTKLSLAEYARRLRSPVLKTEIKDKDLIQFIAKTMDIVQRATTASRAEEEKNGNTTNIFNILDQSIQDNIQINTYDYDEEND